MSLELSLLVLESVLLVFTIILLLYSIREGRGREHLLLEVDRATKTFTRVEYFLAVVDSITDAKKEVTGLITGRLPAHEDKKRTADIVSAIEKMTRSGVRIKYLLPRFHDRLHIGFLYTMAGAEIRLSSCSMLHDFRYMVVDDDLVVIGVPESVGLKEATKKGYQIRSEGLASVLKENFNNCWEKAASFRDYLAEVMKETNASARHMAKELSIDEAELEKFLSAHKTA